ncbi:MAG: DEAD/DEAH box helicase family protein [Lachnospiraceae bacterium]|nr:DEAD/DEAH box helicase family protein [Lachnospiraceae bacterium]
MAEYHIAEKVGEENLALRMERRDVMTGDRDQSRFLYSQLKMSILQADRIDLIVSFLMESGVRLLLRDLQMALERGVQIRLLTGNYLGITQPAALYLLKRELGPAMDLRFYHDQRRSFHPKAYIFHYKQGSEIYIGSSNVSRSALTSGIEWNYRLDSRKDAENFQLFYETFEDLFYHHAIVIDDEELKRYSKSWKRPAVAKDLERYDLAEEDNRQYDPAEEKNQKVEALYQPRGVQIEALYALESSRAEGARKGLIHGATGIGKTYLAAFDSVNYNRVLFVAHREEILKQAAVSFRNVRHSEDYGFFWEGQKDTDKSVLFASVASLGREQYLQEAYFARDSFDYLVIDEFHHAVNEQYRRIIDYFQPKFLLGLTATPERMDGRNIYEICDYNVPYEISLQEAINKGMLVPFHYYGVYDETDYSGFRLVKGRYREEELNRAYIGNVKRYDLIYRYYQKYGSRRALGFCCSRLHAEEMAREFCHRGIPAAAVYSGSQGEFSKPRDAAVEQLKKGEIRVIFSVDMFNEGMDIPAVDMVLFLRPTESPVVFLQQLGRGLRKSRGKTYLNVLDFIGNYEKAGRAPFLLSEKCQGGREVFDPKGKKGFWENFEFPEDCIVDFDLRLMDLFWEMQKRKVTIREMILAEYERIKELLNGKRPGRMELFTYMEDGIYQLCMSHPKENPFRRYLSYLQEICELSQEEKELCDGIGREFLLLLETTDMQKVYKMPVLSAFYHGGEIRMAITEEEVLESWKDFFDQGTNWKDLGKEITYEEYQAKTDRWHLSQIKKNPVRFLKASGKGFFVEKEGYVLALREDLKEVVQRKAFQCHMKDIIEYRTMEYYRRRYQEKAEK